MIVRLVCRQRLRVATRTIGCDLCAAVRPAQGYRFRWVDGEVSALGPVKLCPDCRARLDAAFATVRGGCASGAGAGTPDAA